MNPPLPKRGRSPAGLRPVIDKLLDHIPPSRVNGGRTPNGGYSKPPVESIRRQPSPFLILIFLLILIPIPACLLLTSCGNPPANPAGEVVIYTALDQIYSEPILKKFEASTGIKVRAVYDAEASKTVGLVTRLMAEKGRPQCDVFWNNEIIRTLALKREGILAPYDAPNAAGIPAAFRDPAHHWTGFAARSRVIAYNTKLIPNPDSVPHSIDQLQDPKWSGQIAMAYPLFGTTSTHAAVLFQLWGKKKTESFFNALSANKVHILDGNMMAARSAADGETALALTDSDDANLLRSEGKPIAFLPLDHDGKGALLIPNTVAIVAGAPHRPQAEKLLDYLLSPAVEEALAASPSGQIPLRPGLRRPAWVHEHTPTPIRIYGEVDYEAASKQIEPSATFLQEKFAHP